MDIRITPLNKTVTATTGSNLLDILRDNEIPISYSCLSGRCGTCRCKVIEGNVSGPPAADGRLARDGQYVLACQSVIESDCAIEVPEPDEVVIHPAKTLKGTVTAYEVLSADVRRLRLKTNKPLEFSPGQYAHLTFRGPEGTRAYSMAGLAEDGELEFHIRLVPGGRVTSRLDDSIERGSVVKVNGPLGASYLRRKHAGPMLCVASGTGLAPILSIVRGALESGMENPIHLIFGARTQEDLYGVTYLKTLAADFPNFDYCITLNHTNDLNNYSRGLVTDAIAQRFPNLAGWRIYLAGAPVMVEAASVACTNRGASIEHIYADAFYPSGV
jgi:ferredoxin-NAD(P)+ reductase (naphthalene dioxygenase ferredoxin-specific)